MSVLHGKVAIVTGAASGIGRAASLLFARQGARVVLADLNIKDGVRAAAEASETGQDCVFQQADVALEGDIAALVDLAQKQFGKLDIMFNNAGYGGAMGRLHEISAEDWDRTQSINLRSVFLGMKHSIPAMMRTGGGAVISTSSVAGVTAFQDALPYAAAKAAVIHLTRVAALSYAPDNIRINCIAPGGISTPAVWKALGADRAGIETMLAQAQPVPRVGQPEDIAEAALFLASDASRFVTGQTLVVDGGGTIGSMLSAVRGDTREPHFQGPSFETD